MKLSKKLTESQELFMFSKAKFPAIVGGLGSGKSWGGIARICKLMLDEGRGKNYAYYFPTYDLVKLRGIPGMIDEIASMGLKHKVNMQMSIVSVIGYGDIIFRSYDRPEKIIAYEVAHSVVDELDTIGYEKAKFSWRKVVERNRQPCKHPSGNSVGCVTTPDRGKKGYVYEKWGDNPQPGYELIKASTYDNPFLPDDYIANISANYNPTLARLFLEGEFVNLDGAAIFSEESLLINDTPAPIPEYIDGVFAVIDSAIKTGSKNDGTAVTYFGESKYHGIPLTILDWEIRQIDAAHLEHWLPSVFENLERLAALTKARHGASGGVYIEDKASGSILLQQSKTKSHLFGMKTTAIKGDLTALGKEERAMKVSSHVFRGSVKITEPAFNKVTTYKGRTRNHLLNEVTSFSIGAQSKEGDDLLDTFTYGIAISLG